MALAFSACVPADKPQWQITYIAVVTTVYLASLCTFWPWKGRLLNYMDAVSMIVINLVIVSSGAFVPKTEVETDVIPFVAFHFVLFAFFSINAVGLVVAVGYYMNKNGI